jgi:hypothetical protein
MTWDVKSELPLVRFPPPPRRESQLRGLIRWSKRGSIHGQYTTVDNPNPGSSAERAGLEEQHNPAGRLHHLLSGVKNYNPSNERLWQVWGHVLDIEPPRASEVFGQLALGADLPTRKSADP